MKILEKCQRKKIYGMNKRSLRILEYPKILEQLAGYAASRGAKKKCLRLSPMKDMAEIGTAQEETRDAFLRLEKDGNVSFAGVTDVMGSLKRLEIHASLDAPELLDIAALLETAESVRSYGLLPEERDADSPGGGLDSLSGRFHDLAVLRDVSTEIRRCLLDSETFADDASPALKNIRRKIENENKDLHKLLERLLRSTADQNLLTDALITQRNGRYCIPVRAEHKSHFSGMIHDRSASGSTLFIEPMEAVQMNNTIRELMDDEKEEMQKILAGLSEMAGACVPEIESDHQLLTELDFIFAKAKYARATKASQPILNDEGQVELKRAVHPLLDPKTAVPVDISLGEDYTSLIITGPNTGGKTVSLKTLGLLTLMGQSGLHIPAGEGSRLSVFTDVFADIGDEQSIEQNLSTFSSHMKNIIYITQHADYRSLCLFDEPGGGTDPAEGAALAIAILNSLKRRGARVMATTHYTELKTYALSEDGVMNASCEFDEKTLQPTYRLLIGVPGSSNAFAIARRLGMEQSIIEEARSGMAEDRVRMEEILAELDRLRRNAEEEQNRAAEARRSAEALERRLSEQEKNLKEKKEKLLEDARIEAQLILEDAKETADEAIRDFHKWQKNPHGSSISDMEKKRTRLREKAGEYQKAAPKAKRSGRKTGELKTGDPVLVLSLDTEGKILSGPDAKGRFLVGMGILQSKFAAQDLELLDAPAEMPEEPVQKTGYGRMANAINFKPELNLLGKTVDEALQLLDQFLDDALMAHASSVTIIHGKGTGALRRAVTEHLRKTSYVKKFRAGEYGEGDAGVTICEL